MQRALQLLCVALAASAVVALDVGAPGPAGGLLQGDFDVRAEWTSVLDWVTKRSDDVNGTGILLVALETVIPYLPADLVNDLSAGNWTGTVLAPTDEAFDALGDLVDTLLADPEKLAEIIAYHLIPDAALTLGDVKAADGSVVQTLLDGTTGQLQVRQGGKKAAVLTTSGQDVPIYQYNLGAGSAVVHTIKQVLVPGTIVFGAAPPTAA